MAKAIILGAGFTKAFIPKAPLTSELRERLQADAVCGGVLRGVSAALPGIDASSSIDRILTGLELSILFSSTKSEKSRLDSYRDQIQRSVHDEFVQYHETPEMIEFGKAVPPSTVAINFNFDNSFDRAMMAAGQWSPREGYGGMPTYVPTQSPIPVNPNRIRIFRPNGGVSILRYDAYGGEGVHFSLEPRINGTYYPISGCDFEALGASQTSTAVIGPSHLQRYGSEFRRIWRESFQALEGTDELIVAGYSFPETDLMAPWLLDSFIKKWDRKNKLPLHVFDPAAENVLGRINRHLNGGVKLRFEINKYEGGIELHQDKLREVLSD